VTRGLHFPDPSAYCGVDLPTPTRAKFPLATLFFFHALPMGMWFVPLSNILKAHGYAPLIPWVMACSGVSAFISPLIVGSLADQKIPPLRLLRWLAWGTGALMLLTAHAIEARWSAAVVLGLAQVQSLLASPTWGLSNTIILAELREPSREFGPLRACATFGWMVGGWLVSLVLHADTSVVAAYAAAGFWIFLGMLTWTLRERAPVDQRADRSWREILGLDALTLLRHREHRIVFITAALYSAPLAAFYPYSPPHLRDLGVEAATAVMSLGQITEVLVMLVLAGLLARVRLKWVFISGIGFGLLRYVIFTTDERGWVIGGIVLHGLAYTLYFITLQIYLEDRIDPKWRSRAQALLTLLTGGVGHLAGMLGSGWWHAVCSSGDHTDWPRFWTGLWIATAAVFVFFALTYKGRRNET
jgi:hypothetical protein